LSGKSLFFSLSIKHQNLKKMKHLVKKYLLGQLNPQEKANFEKALQTDLELQELVEFYKKIPDLDNLQKNIDENFEEVLAKNQKPNISLKEIQAYKNDTMSVYQRRAFEKKLQKNPEVWKKIMHQQTEKSISKKSYAIVAACLILFVLGGTFWWNYQKQSEKIADNYAQVDSMALVKNNQFGKTSDNYSHLDPLSVLDMSQQPSLVFKELFTEASTTGVLEDTLQEQLVAVLKNPSQEYEILEHNKRLKKITIKEYVSVFKAENYNLKLMCGVDAEDKQKNHYVFLLIKPDENYKRVGSIYASLQQNKLFIDSICIDSTIRIKPILKIVQ